MRALPGLGDMLCLVPALRALRGAWPDAHVTLLGLPWARSLVDRFDAYLDAFLAFPGFPGIPERTLRPRELTRFLHEIQARPFDLALQMHGSGAYSNAFTALLGARYSAGFHPPGGYRPDAARYRPYPEDDPEVRRWLQLTESLGCPTRGEALEFPVDDADRRALAALPETAALEAGRYACVHPGASEAGRRWPPERFARVADALAARGLRVVVTGTDDDAPATRAMRRAMRTDATDLTGRTGLGAVAALLAGARLVVCNDTGVSHLAAALAVPSVVLFLASDPGRWAPLDHERHRPVGRPGAPGARPPKVDDVLPQVDGLLRPGVGHAA